MFELMRFKLLLKKYQNIFSDILGDFELEKLETGEIVLKIKLVKQQLLVSWEI